MDIRGIQCSPQQLACGFEGRIGKGWPAVSIIISVGAALTRISVGFLSIPQTSKFHTSHRESQEWKILLLEEWSRVI